MGVYKRKDSPYWYYSFTDRLTGKRYQGCTGVENKMAARAFLEKKKADPERREEKGLFFILADFLEATKEKRSHERDVLTAPAIASFFGDIPVTQIEGNEAGIRRYMAARLSGSVVVKYRYDESKMRFEICEHKQRAAVSRTTVNRDLSLIQTAFNHAIERGHAQKNPIRRKMKSRDAEEQAKKTIFLTQEEITLYLDACAPQYRPVAETALRTGMRIGEIRDLTWENVDLRNGIIYVKKGKTGAREVIIPDSLIPILRGLESRKIGGYVFLNRDGGRYQDFRRAHQHTLMRSGIQDKRFAALEYVEDPEQRKREIRKNAITLHTLRHSFASHLATSCRDLNVVRESLGHADISTTMRYAHLTKDRQRAAIEEMTASIGQAGKNCYNTATVIPISENSKTHSVKKTAELL